MEIVLPPSYNDFHFSCTDAAHIPLTPNPQVSSPLGCCLTSGHLCVNDWWPRPGTSAHAPQDLGGSAALCNHSRARPSLTFDLLDRLTSFVSASSLSSFGEKDFSQFNVYVSIKAGLLLSFWIFFLCFIRTSISWLSVNFVTVVKSTLSHHWKMFLLTTTIVEPLEIVWSCTVRHVWTESSAEVNKSSILVLTIW